MGMSTERDFSNGLSLSSYIRYTLKRLMRIAPPYYISIVVWIFIMQVYKVAPKPSELRDVVTHLTFTHNLFQDTFFSISGVYWSIGVEMQFYLVLPFIISMCRGPLSSLLVFLISLVVSIATYGSDLSVVYKWGLMNYLVLFIYGWALYTYKTLLISIINLTKITYFAIPFFVLLLLYSVNGGNNQKMYELVAALTYGIIMLKLGDFIPKDSKSQLLQVLLIVGKSSFSIYLYNYIYNFVMPRTQSPFAIAFMFAGVVGFGVMMYLLVEVNTEKLRSKLFKKKNSFKANGTTDKSAYSIAGK